MDWKIEVAHKINLETQASIEPNSPEASEDLQQLKDHIKESIRQSMENFLSSDEFDKWFESQLAQNNARLKRDKSLLGQIIFAIKKIR